MFRARGYMVMRSISWPRRHSWHRARAMSVLSVWEVSGAAGWAVRKNHDFARTDGLANEHGRIRFWAAVQE